MEGMIAACFSRELEIGRDRFNSLFAQARRDHPRLEGEVLLDFLRRRVDPIVRKAAESHYEGISGIVDAIYRVVLEMLCKGLIGPKARRCELEALWCDLMVGTAPLVAQSPHELTSFLTNALYNVLTAPRCRAVEWTQLVGRVAGHCDQVAQLLDVTLVAAWLSGMAQYRQPALRKLRDLPSVIVAELLSCEKSYASTERLVDALATDPWFRANGPVHDTGVILRAETGGFRGCGGEFLRPPRVAAQDDNIFASDGATCWWLLVDAFGVCFHRLSVELPVDRSSRRYSVGKDGTVRGPRTATKFAFLAGASSYAATATTLAVTLPHSHRVFLLSESAP